MEKDQALFYTRENPKGTQLDAVRKQIDDLAWLLDDCFGIPGTRWRFGLDSLIGLVPGAGDIVSSIFGLVLLFRAFQFRLPKIVIARMIANHLLDLTIGAIPGVGDLFDFLFKSNSKNKQLFHKYALEPAADTTGHWIFLVGLVVGFVLMIVLMVLAGSYLVYQVLHQFAK